MGEHEMSHRPSIVDYAEARTTLASQMSILAFGEGCSAEAALAASTSLAAVRAFRAAPRVSAYASI